MQALIPVNTPATVLVATFQATSTSGDKGLHYHPGIVYLFVLWTFLLHLLPSLPRHLHRRNWAYSENGLADIFGVSIRVRLFPRRRAFQLQRTHRNRRTGPQRKTLRREQTEKEAGGASHFPAWNLPAARPQFRLSFLLRFARACEPEGLTCQILNIISWRITNELLSTDEGQSPKCLDYSNWT